MSTTAELLAAEFTHGEVRQFQGRGGQTFDYIEDETVMDRLDAVLGVGSWSIEVEPIGIADGIVKVRLSGTTPDGKAFRHEDFGYASNAGPQAEGLKEAVSDGIRRCGRYLGVGRYLYKKHGPTRAAAPARPPVARPVAPRPRAVPNAPDELSEEDVDALFAASPNATGGGTPPAASGSHNPPLTFRELADLAEARGIAKNAIYQTADKLFGRGTKVTELDSEQRGQIADEMGLSA